MMKFEISNLKRRLSRTATFLARLSLAIVLLIPPLAASQAVVAQQSDPPSQPDAKQDESPKGEGEKNEDEKDKPAPPSSLDVM